MRSGGEMGVGLAPGLSRKLKKVLESGGRAESADLVASLSTLSELYDENTPANRRNLRSTIETRSLSINLHFLEASGAALASLDRVEAEVDALVSCCDRIAAALSSCSHSTADIVSATERLRRDLDLTAERQRIVSAFLSDFQLSPAQMKALREDDLSRAFFDALSHVHRIHANCKLLLRTHHQRAGLDLMDMMAVFQEAAYERLCRWVQAQCRQLGDSDHPEVSDLLKTAVCCLRERPVLFKYCAEEVANMRHNALFRRFITALTRGGPGGMPRPIEVHAHDPLRYVGDMLGWLHQALASEREFVTLLLHPDEDDSRQGKVESDLKFVMDRIFEGVCRPFKVRVEQVFQSQPNLIISCKLSNTLEFYCYTISDLLGKETALSNTLLTLKEAAQKTFFEVVKIRGEKLVRYPPLVAVDLSPPPAVREGVSVLLEIIETHDSMMVPASAKTPDFDPIISALLNPIIQMCEQAAEAHKSKGVGNSSRRGGRPSAESDSGRSSVDALLSSSSSSSDSISSSSSSQAQVFLINCLCAIQQPLLGHEVAAEYVTKLGKMIDDHLRILAQKEVDGILGKCGLLHKMQHFREGGADDGILSQMDDTSPAALSECLKAFFQLILASESLLPEFELVQVPKLRSEASVQVAKSLAEAYEVIHDAIVDPKNGYPEPKTLARHPPHQIRTILGI